MKPTVIYKTNYYPSAISFGSSSSADSAVGRSIYFDRVVGGNRDYRNPDLDAVAKPDES